MEHQTTQQQPAPKTFTRTDIHQQVTDTIIQQLEAGTVPWHKPWKGDNNNPFTLPKNFTTQNKYRGINILLLWSSALVNDYSTQEWASFKQWQSKKESIRKGEKGSMIVYYDTFEKEVDGKIEKIPFLKSSVVFNRCQLASYTPPQPEPAKPNEPVLQKIKHVDDFVANTEVIIRHGGNTACYIPATDEILMPHPDNFINTQSRNSQEGYYSTLAHEICHWTGSEKRLNRKLGRKFGIEEYATEELIAELGSAFLCAELQITTTPKPDHASYIASWLKALKENKHCVITAASEASKAVAYLQDLQPNT